ncbi:MAG: DUF4214 domain-containing protein [Gemmataceae bacterium]
MKSTLLGWFHRNLGPSNPEKAPASRPRLSCEQLEDRVVPSAVNDAYVQQLYKDLLQRPADPAAIQIYGSLLDAGVPKAQIALNIESSAEFRSLVVERLYQTYLGRPADQLGLLTWSIRIQQDGIQEVQAEILGSAEFLQKAGGTNADFLSAVYLNALARPIDPTGARGFGNDLLHGKSRVDVARELLSTDASHKAAVDQLYLEFLGRHAEAAGADHWANLMRQGMSLQGVIAGIVSSPEFIARANAAPAKPTVTTPTSAKITQATSFTITGTAEAGTLVKIHANGGVVGTQQLAPTATTYSISVRLTVNTANNFTVTATDSFGRQSAPTTVPTITQTTRPVTVTSPGNQTKREGDAVNLPIQATDINGRTLTYSATGLPAGLSINATTGRITGTISSGASTSSPYTVKVTATNGTNQGSATFTWTVNPPAPTITVPATQQNVNGAVVSGVTVTATGTGSGAITYSASNLPSGLTINSTTGVISGTISNTGSNTSPYKVTVSATQNGQTANASFTWVVTLGSTSAIPVSLTDPGWVTVPSGVRYLDTTVGTGVSAVAGKTINVDYVGYLTNGTIFDSGNGFSSKLDTAHLIKGWVDAVPGMKVGGVRYLDIPASLAYGATGSGSVPPNAELVFKITLNSVT